MYRGPPPPNNYGERDRYRPNYNGEPRPVQRGREAYAPPSASPYPPPQQYNTAPYSAARPGQDYYSQYGNYAPYNAGYPPGPVLPHPSPYDYPGPPAEARPYNPTPPLKQQPAFRPNDRKQPSPISQSVIFVGLPPHVTEDLLRAFLEEQGAPIDSTTVIMDRETGLSKRFGFARFASADHARAFLEPNFPSVTWKEPASSAASGYDGCRLKIDFSQTDKSPREARKDTGGKSRSAEVANDGTKHIAQRATRYLLLCRLDPQSPESEIANALHTTLTHHSQNPHIQRVMLVKDRRSQASWGFAFVEFLDQKSASEALKTLNSPEIHPQGFRIGNATVGITFGSADSFRPTYTPSEWSFVNYQTGKDMIYSDSHAFLGIYEYPDVKRFDPSAQTGPPVDEDEAFLQSLDTDQTAAPALDAPAKSDDAASKAPIPSAVAIKKNTAQIEHWNRKKEDIDAAAAPKAAYSAPAQTVDQFPYADAVKFQCLLCMRQFKNLDQLKRHDKESGLHKTNLEDEAKREAATARKAALAPSQPHDDPDGTPIYRDRAAERRQALGQPDRPALEESPQSRKRARPDPEPAVQPNRDGIAEDNRGRRMLEASGWQAGQGLNAGGRADIVEARHYVPGAGLGASQGTAIGGPDRWNDPSAYGRERARARYQ